MNLFSTWNVRRQERIVQCRDEVVTAPAYHNVVRYKFADLYQSCFTPLTLGSPGIAMNIVNICRLLVAATCGRSSCMGSIRSMLAKVTLRCFSSLRGAQSPHPALVTTPATRQLQGSCCDITIIISTVYRVTHVLWDQRATLQMIKNRLLLILSRLLHFHNFTIADITLTIYVSLT